MGLFGWLFGRKARKCRKCSNPIAIESRWDICETCGRQHVARIAEQVYPSKPVAPHVSTPEPEPVRRRDNDDGCDSSSDFDGGTSSD